MMTCIDSIHSSCFVDNNRGYVIKTTWHPVDILFSTVPTKYIGKYQSKAGKYWYVFMQRRVQIATKKELKKILGNSKDYGIAYTYNWNEKYRPVVQHLLSVGKKYNLYRDSIILDIKPENFGWYRSKFVYIDPGYYDVITPVPNIDSLFPTPLMTSSQVLYHVIQLRNSIGNYDNSVI